MTKWEIDTKIEKLIEENCKEIPWEGTEIDKHGLKQSILDFVKELSFTDLTKIREMI